MASANAFLTQLEQLKLLDERVLAQLRKQVAGAKGSVSAQTVAKVLVDNGHLTVFQAKKIISDLAPEDGSSPSETPSKTPSKSSAKNTSNQAGMKPAARPQPPEEELGLVADEDLGLADDADGLAPIEDDDGLMPLDEDDADGLSPIDDDLDGLTPLDDDGLAPMDDDGGLEPVAESPAPAAASLFDKLPAASVPEASAAAGLDDILGGATADPLADPLLSSAATAESASPLLGPAKPSGGLLSGLFGGGKTKVKNKNPWDSALIYVGGGALLFLGFAFLMLYLLLARGSASEAFQLAEEDFQKQAYSQAIAKYENYLKRYGGSDAEDTSLAKVRIGMCQIRQSVDAGDTVEALSVTEEILKSIEGEVKFDEARSELADILPNIAKTLADQARKATNNIPQATELLGHAERAIELVNDGAYIPPQLRPPVEAKVAAIQEDMAFVKREIERDRELKLAVEKMQADTTAGKTTAAFEVRRELLKRYPGVDVTEPVVQATLAITAKERELVEVISKAIEPAPASAGANNVHEVVLTDGPPASGGAAGPIVTMLLRGAVYGLDSSSGRVVWRRFVGLESVTQPLPISTAPNADVIVIDRAQQALLRLANNDGSIQWRLVLGEPFAPPTIAGDKLLVSTSAGGVLEVDLASGASTRQAQLPQGAAMGAATDARRPYFYQLGAHSTLFALSTTDLKCAEAYFLGHPEGAIAASPVCAGGQIFIAVNEGADYAMVHVVSTDSEGLSLSKTFDPVRVKGHVVTPPLVDGRRVYVFTNLGGVHVFDIDPANTTQPVQELTRLIPTRKTPLVGYATVREGKLWLGDERLTMYELQPARKELTRRWSRYEGEIFLAPPQPVGTSLIVPRARQTAGDVFIGGVQISDGSPTWKNSVGVPVLDLVPTGSGAFVLNANGSAFSVPAPVGSDAIIDVAAARLDTVAEPPQFVHAVRLPNDLIALLPADGKAQWGLAKVGVNKVVLIPWHEPLQIAAVGAALDDGLLLPLVNGQVVLATPTNGKPLLFPFQPRLGAMSNIAWSQPLVIRGATTTFAVADTHGEQLYLVGRKEQPQPHLASSAQAKLEGKLSGELAQLEDAIVAVVKKADAQALQSFTLPDLQPGASLPLAGTLMFGPAAVEDAAFVVTDQAGLVCVDAKLTQRWALPLKGVGLVAPPLQHEASYIVATTSGELLVVDGATGEVKKTLATQRPLGGSPVVIGDQLYCPGIDGAVYVVPLAEIEG